MKITVKSKYAGIQIEETKYTAPDERIQLTEYAVHQVKLMTKLVQKTEGDAQNGSSKTRD